MSTKTANGENQLSTSLNDNVDLFFNIGSARKAQEKALGMFNKAIKEDKKTAIAILAWCRDARNGAGERDTFKNLFRVVIEKYPKLASKIIDVIPELGRYDDLNVAINTSLEDKAMDIWIKALEDGNELAYKWVNIKKDNRLRKRMGLNQKQFRHKIVAGRPNIIETKMCKKQWKDISFDKVPSLCMKKNSKIFSAHDPSRYDSWLNDKDSKVNASVLYPYEIYKKWQSGETTLAQKQWDALDIPVDANILPMIDVSGSMSSAQATNNISCMDVAISLGLYLAHKNKGSFKNYVLNFSEKSELVGLQGNLNDDLKKIRRFPWGMSTNLQKAYSNLLDIAIKVGATDDDMPEYLVILSDMQFDQAVSRSSGTSHEKMEVMFNDKGYKLPKIIYWNLNSNYCHGFPTASTENGVAMVSGFSPHIMKSIANAKIDEISPVNVMNSTIEKYRDYLK